MSEVKYFMAIVSDLHWCSRDSKPHVFQSILDEIQADKWVINGDWMDWLVAETDPEYPLLEEVRERSLIEDWYLVPGNHDHRKMYSDFELGKVKIVKKIKVRIGGKTFLIVHGHQFDFFLHHWPRVVQILGGLHEVLRFFNPRDPFDRKESFYKKRVFNSPIWNLLSGKIAQRALRKGRKEGVDAIICGHTHKARIDEYKGVMHYNGGSLTENICSMITISHDGTVTMHKFSDQGEYLGVYDLAA